MTEEQVKALFLLSGIKTKSYHKLENQYWPLCKTYDDIRRNSPWWLVQTEFGFIKVGWRKNVMLIDWADTPYRIGEGQHFKDRPECIIPGITSDDVTQGATFIHAWGYHKALQYLTLIHLRLQQVRTAYDDTED